MERLDLIAYSRFGLIITEIWPTDLTFPLSDFSEPIDVDGMNDVRMG
jgi:hypothetical protein